MGNIMKRGFSFLLAIITIAGAYGTDKVHVLEAGETLYSLSKKYGIDVDVLLSENGISNPSLLSVGMRLIIPGIDAVSDTTVSDEVDLHTVVPGDTYYSIAGKHGLSVDELLALNGRNTGRILRVGETLIVRKVTGGDIQPAPPNPRPSSQPKETPVMVEVPQWPVSGLKRPLDGKLVGVSIEADAKSYVCAVSAGNVVWTGPYRGFGNVVLIDSDGYIYLYGGNEDLFVNVGQDISAGNRIGRLGDAGPEGGRREMYFSVFKGGVPVSPENAPRG